MTNTRSAIEADALVITSDGAELGRVSAHTEHAFKVDAPMQPDYWLSNATVMGLRDGQVVVGFEEAHVEEFKEPSAEAAGRVKAIQVLVQMHGETKAQFRTLLGTANPSTASRLWSEMQQAIEVHEQMEEEYLYGPLHAGMSGQELGDYEAQHAKEVQQAESMIQRSAQYQAGSHEWIEALSEIREMLEEHMSEEEENIFPQVMSSWDDARLVEAGDQMLAMKNSRLGPAASTAA